MNAELIPRTHDLDDILLNLKGKIENQKKSVENELAIRGA
jgi:HEPN domain-containing protein